MNISRTGVQVYPLRPEGQRVQYRPPEEVFSADSVASLASVPVTFGHPPVPVTPSNAAMYQKGNMTDRDPQTRVVLDSDPNEWLRSEAVIADGGVQSELEAAPAGGLQVSAGYSCVLDLTPGVAPDGTAYDCVQRDIKFNHVAILGVAEKARAGANARTILDKEDQVKIIILDGQEYEVGSDRHIEKLSADAKNAIALADRAEGERDELRTQVDSLKGELEALKGQLTDSALDARVAERLDVLRKAAQFLAADYDTDGKSNLDVMRDALEAVHGQNFADKSADHVAGRFAQMTDAKVPAEFAVAPDQRRAATAAPKQVQDSDDEFRKALEAQLKNSEGAE